jgi:hypothetical protein
VIPRDASVFPGNGFPFYTRHCLHFNCKTNQQKNTKAKREAAGGFLSRTSGSQAILIIFFIEVRGDVIYFLPVKLIDFTKQLRINCTVQYRFS